MDQARRIFEPLAKLCNQHLSTILEHQATDTEGRSLARLLRTKPNDLQYELFEENISFEDAIDDLEPIICHAADVISETRKPAMPDKWVTHRAKVLQEQLTVRKKIDTQEAIATISRDERWLDDKKGERYIAIRAMKMVADIAPLKAIYSPGTRVARSILVWTGVY